MTNKRKRLSDAQELILTEAFEKDQRPKMNLIWKIFYQAQLYASATHYIIFDHIDEKGRSLLSTLGTTGSIFLNGDTGTYHKIIGAITDGAPMLLLESTGGVSQAFAYVMKAVRLLKPKWDVDFVMRLVTEYKARAARDKQGQVQQRQENKRFMLDNISLLDKELARIDLMLSAESTEETPNRVSRSQLDAICLIVHPECRECFSPLKRKLWME